MVGIMKPSLHYYSRRVVLYEGRTPEGVVNLSDRLSHESRAGQAPRTRGEDPTVLVVIDATTAAEPYWLGLGPIELARVGLYRLWRLDRHQLDARARAVVASGGARLGWRDPRPERY